MNFLTLYNFLKMGKTDIDPYSIEEQNERRQFHRERREDEEKERDASSLWNPHVIEDPLKSDSIVYDTFDPSNLEDPKILVPQSSGDNKALSFYSTVISNNCGKGVIYWNNYEILSIDEIRKANNYGYEKRNHKDTDWLFFYAEMFSFSDFRRYWGLPNDMTFSEWINGLNLDPSPNNGNENERLTYNICHNRTDIPDD